MNHYRVFKRSCTNFEQFARARKITEATGLTFEAAREMCQRFNATRTPAQVKRGTKYEFTAE